MFNAASFLSNATVNIWDVTESKTPAGAVKNIYSLFLTGLQGRIEKKEVDSPVEIDGRAYRAYYTLDLWLQADGELPAIKENQIVEDVTNADFPKRYLIYEVEAGHLFKTKPYKIQARMIVMNDERFTNFTRVM